MTKKMFVLYSKFLRPKKQFAFGKTNRRAPWR